LGICGDELSLPLEFVRGGYEGVFSTLFHKASSLVTVVFIV